MYILDTDTPIFDIPVFNTPVLDTPILDTLVLDTSILDTPVLDTVIYTRYDLSISSAEVLSKRRWQSQAHSRAGLWIDFWMLSKLIFHQSRELWELYSGSGAALQAPEILEPAQSSRRRRAGGRSTPAVGDNTSVVAPAQHRCVQPPRASCSHRLCRVGRARAAHSITACSSVMAGRSCRAG